MADTGYKQPRSYKKKEVEVFSGLTAAQEAYCRARAMGMGAQEAIDASNARIKVNTAHHWEMKPHIRDRISELSELATKSAILKTGLDRQWVISRLMTVTERCMQAEPVLDKEGNETGQYTFDSGGAIRSLTKLGEELGMFKPRDEKPVDEYANLTDDDLARIASELAAQTGLIADLARAKTQAGQEQVIEVQAISKAN
jgi:phage terminase small subunit